MTACPCFQGSGKSHRGSIKSTTSSVYLGDIRARQPIFTVWEKQRNRKEVHWLVECFAESLGVFFYVYAGLGSTAAFVIGNILKQPLSSIFQIGFAYAFGILLALGVCSSTSGGHFNPCVTVAFVIYRGFPPRKAFRYIVAQILGAYIAGIIVYGQYKNFIVLAEGVLAEAGLLESTQFTPNGPPGIFALYLSPEQSLGRAFLTEFVMDTVLAIVIWAAIDPTNEIIPPVMSPVLVAVGYGMAIWGYATPGIALNAARDVGGRLVAITIWGTQAGGGRYAAIAALTNIPGTLFGAFLYEIFLTDSDRVVARPHLELLSGFMGHRRHRTTHHESSLREILDRRERRGVDSSADEKPGTDSFEHSNV